MKRDRTIYWIFTGLLCLFMLFQTLGSFAQTAMIGDMYESLGFPRWLVIPLGVAKFLAVLAILTKRSALLKKLAYYGLGIDFVLALYAHLSVGDANWAGPLVAIVLWLGSYTYDRKIFR